MNLTDVVLEEGKVIHRQEDIAITSFDFPFGSFPITKKHPLTLTIENKGKKVLGIQGSITLNVMIPCARCLDDVPTKLVLDFEKEVDMKQTEEERLEALDESDFLNGYNLDVDKLVYGEALTNWPSRVLCKEDCKGLCKVCGQNLNRGTCDCDSTDLDPRMAKIRDIFSNFKEV
ncbi:MAG: DUF177 domain-containing protein [Lachnospiraceae bacterium]|nr:DUF177 domain-containing protein [Lachnospiraceae bacterium]MDD3796992.1 DUF177 domain-containing protein [Lachnospiraceae bacterium]